MDDARALKICYNLLSRMTPEAKIASLNWLHSRIASDEKAAIKPPCGRRDEMRAQKAVGAAAMSLVSLIKASGASTARRAVELRGPINADVVVSVKTVRDHN